MTYLTLSPFRRGGGRFGFLNMLIWQDNAVPLLQALAEAITLPLELQDVAAMGEAVQQGAGQVGAPNTSVHSAWLRRWASWAST